MNRNHEVERLCLNQIDYMRGVGADARWCAVAKTNIQQGFMALNRALTRPEGD